MKSGEVIIGSQMKKASTWIYLLLWKTSQSYVLHGRHSLITHSALTTTDPRAPSRVFKLQTHQDHLNTLQAHNCKTVVVVGAGVGGLAVASRLASSLSKDQPKTRVIVLEKNGEEWIGGRCGSFNVLVDGYGSFRHERGPSLLLLKDEYLKLFQDCGDRNAKDYGLDIVPCAPAYQVVFDDGDFIHLGFPANVGMSQNMNCTALSILQERTKSRMNDLEEHGFSKWEEYMQITNAYLNCGLPNFIEQKLDLSSFPAFLYEAFRDGAKAWPLRPHSDVLDSVFSSSKMKAMASFQDLYVGLEPYRNVNQPFGGILSKTALAVFGLLSALELHPTNKRAGVFAPIGGFERVSLAFKRLALDCGVEFKYKSYVTNVTSDGVVFTDSSNCTHHLAADLVIVNADLPYSTDTLLRNNVSCDELVRYDWDERFEYSSGVVAFHWSVNKTCINLSTHNVFLVGGTRKGLEDSWESVRESRAAQHGNKVQFQSPCNQFANQSFNFYVHRPTATDPTAAPENCDSIMILVPCPSLRRNETLSLLSRDDAITGYHGQFRDVYIRDMKEAVLSRLSAVDGLQDLREHILHEVVDTPASYADYYNLAAGTPFALSHGLSQLSVLRPGPKYGQYPNVLFVGASARPGNGVPLVLIGAKAVAAEAFTYILEN